MFRKKRNIFSIILENQIVLTIIGLVLLLLLSFPLAKSVSKRYKVNKNIEEMEKEIQNLEKSNSDLKKLISYLESDDFVEEKARLNMGLKKENESVVIIKDYMDKTELDNHNALINKNNANKARSNPQKWFSYFFDN